MNKYLIRFPEMRTWPLSRFQASLVVAETFKFQENIREWCIKNIGPATGYPYWEFTGPWSFPTTADNCHIIYTGIFIFNEEDRLAFKIKYNL